MSPVRKYAIIGTSCSGKTTSLYSVISDLKKKGHICEGLTSSDRNLPYAKERLDTEGIPQVYNVVQQMFNETRLSLRTDLDFYLSDRGVLDLFSYYEYCLPEDDMKIMIRNITYEWIQSYDRIFVYKPLPFVQDGGRPTDEFRLAVDKVLLNMVDDLIREGYPIEYVDWKDRIEERDEYVIKAIEEAETKFK